MNEKYKLGIDMIDKQHEKLIDLIEKLCKIEKNEKNSIKSIILELKKYSEYHFKTEEDYFNSINFTDANNHIHLHNMFIQTVEYYYEYPEKLNKKKLYTFLNTWIKNHILIEDKKYVTEKYIDKNIKENIK